MENYKLFIRSMRVMGKKRFVYLGSIFVMSVTFALFGIMSSLLMKCVVDIAQTGEYERLGYSIAVIVAVSTVWQRSVTTWRQKESMVTCRRRCWMRR